MILLSPWAHAYGPSVAEMLNIIATYVVKVLKGAKPNDLPIEQPSTFEFLINWRPPRRWS